MAYSEKSSMASFSKAIIGVLGIALVVIAFVLLYAVFGKSTELRSKAAEAKTFAYKVWNFDKPGDTEGWWSQNIPLTVANGAMSLKPDQPKPIFQARQLSLTRSEAAPEYIAKQAPIANVDSLKRYPICSQIPAKDPFISSAPVEAFMPKGAKYVKLVVTANAPFVTRVEEQQKNRWGVLKRAPRRISSPQAYGMQIYYAGNAKLFSTPITVPNTLADGKQHEFLVQVPEAGEEQVRCLQIAFPGSPKGLTVSFDSIALMGQKILPPQCLAREIKCIKAPCEVAVSCQQPKPLVSPLPPPPYVITVTPTPTTSPAPTSYTCPSTSMINCMPTTDRSKADPRCGSDYVKWMQSNCPSFRGVAY